MNPLISDIQASNVVATAMHYLIEDLESHGNHVTADHASVLRSLLEALTAYATGKASGIRVFSLITGGGKTSAIAAWIRSLHHHECHQVAVAVAAGRIEAQCDLKRKLMAYGVPEALIGLKHSDERASLPSTENDDRLYQLVTHARVKGDVDHDLFINHRGHQRALMIYDESLIITDPQLISEPRLRGEIASLKAIYRDTDKNVLLAPLFDYLESCTVKIAPTHGESDKGHRTTSEIMFILPQGLKELDPLGLFDYRGRPLLVKRFLDLHDLPLQIIKTKQDTALAYLNQRVPHGLENVMVLDASYPIRELALMDRRIQDCTPEAASNLKRFDNVVVHQMRLASGRESTLKDFLQYDSSQRVRLEEVRKVIEITPRDKSILLFTFKGADGKRGTREIIEDGLRAVGIGPWEKTPLGHPRFNWLTWGKETSLNDFAFCEVVFLVGLMHYPDTHLAASIHGQLGNTCPAVGSKLIDSIGDSELAHLVYQAISRGSCRVTENGQGRPMEVFLFHHKTNLEVTLKRRMPGLKWRTWQPSETTAQRCLGKVNRLIRDIKVYLSDLPLGIQKVKTLDLRKALGVDPSNQTQAKTFTRAIGELLKEGLWVRHGHALVRI